MLTRNQTIEKLVSPFGPIPNGDQGDYFVQVAAQRETREMLLEKYDATEARLWESYAPQFHRRRLEDLRAARARSNALRERMKKKGHTEAEIHRRMWLTPGRGRVARFNKITPDSDAAIVNRQVNRLFK